jgi:hypothetical protein
MKDSPLDHGIRKYDTLQSSTDKKTKSNVNGINNESMVTNNSR